MTEFSSNLCNLKQEFVKNYNGNSHVTEILPNYASSLYSIDHDHLKLLHKFIECNPIYLDKTCKEISELEYTIYGGDLNNYWIDSLKHDLSYAPFYPTWMLSAFCLCLEMKNLGFQQVIDIGSGDGRIAYCAKILGLDTLSIEIDQNLVKLQQEVSSKTNLIFNPFCIDATTYDYEKLTMKKTGFVIGGVPEIGEMLADSVIQNVIKNEFLSKNSLFVLTGSHAKRRFSKEETHFGWGKLINNYGLDVISNLSLPTYWTMDQTFETPYVFTKKR